MAEREAGQSSAVRHSFRIESGAFHDRRFKEGILVVEYAKRLLELHQFANRKSKEEVLVARFKVEPHAEVSADGKTLRVSELTLKLDSPRSAGEVLSLLRRAPPEPPKTDPLSEAEAAVRSCLEAREEAMAFLSRVRTDFRGALLGSAWMWKAGDERTPLEAVVSEYSARVGGGLDAAKTLVSGAEGALGGPTVERLYALACTLGAIQDAMFEGSSELTEEVQALKALGVSVTAEELRMDKLSERVMLRAHPVLQGLSAGVEPPSEPLA